MLVLVATKELQGAGRDDYSLTVDGELVTPLGAGCADGEQCGCDRGFAGLASGLATTTAMVADRPGISGEDLRDAVYDWLDRTGWVELFEATAQERSSHGDDGFDLDHDVDDLIEAVIDEHVDGIASVCSAYPIGTVVVRRGQLVIPRSYPTAA